MTRKGRTKESTKWYSKSRLRDRLVRLRRLAERQVPQAFALGRNLDEICGPPPPAFGLLPTLRAGEIPFGASGKRYAFVPRLHAATRHEDWRWTRPPHVRLRLTCPRLRRGSNGISPAQSVGGGWASPPARSTRLGALQPLGRLASGGSPRPSMRPLGRAHFRRLRQDGPGFAQDLCLAPDALHLAPVRGGCRAYPWRTEISGIVQPFLKDGGAMEGLLALVQSITAADIAI